MSRLESPFAYFDFMSGPNLIGQRLCEAVKGSAALQERGTAECPPLYHEALERGEHAEKHKELARRMITEATRLLHQKLRLSATLPCRHSPAVSFRTTVFIALRVDPRAFCSCVKCDPYQASFLHASGEQQITRVSSASSTSKAARKLPRYLKSTTSNNNR